MNVGARRWLSREILVAGSEDLSPTPGIPITEGENWPLQVVLGPPPIWCGVVYSSPTPSTVNKLKCNKMLHIEF